MGFKFFAAGALTALALLTACGGGTPVDPFRPTRYLAMGDENSYIEKATGKKYTVNAVLAGTSTINCNANTIWVQQLATEFNLQLDECPGITVGTEAGTAKILAAPGAKVAQLVTQVDGVFSSFVEKDLVTVLVGANDVLELYASYDSGAVTEAQALTELNTRGKLIGTQVNRIARAGPATIVSTVPDLGVSPFGLAEKAAKPTLDRSALLTRMVDAINTGMRTTIINDGRLIGLVLADELTQTANKYPGAYGFYNSTTPVCLTTAPLPNCSALTLVVTDVDNHVGDSMTFAYADSTHFSPGAHFRLGELAISRAVNNPF